MIKTVNATLFTLIITVFGLGTVLQWPNLPPYAVNQIVSGKAATLAEKEIDEQVLLKQQLIKIWSRMRFALFNEAKSGVIVGESGWLFSREEYSWPHNGGDILKQNISTIKAVNHLLNENDVKLHVLLVPTKVEVYQRYASLDSPQLVHQLRQNTHSELTSEGVSTIDSYQALISASAKELVFLKTDTHWTPFGAGSAAKVLALQLSEVHQKINFETTLKPPQEYFGDLTNFIPMGEQWLENYLSPDLISVPVTTQVQTANDSLFSEVSEPSIAIVGTSFSANSNWDFIGSLQSAFNAEITNFAVEGQGPFEPMQAFIEEELLQETEFRHVIWEIPVRYMIQPSTFTTVSLMEKRRNK